MLIEGSPPPIFHVSHVMCPVSYVRCHMSRVRCQMSQKKLNQLANGLLSTRLPRLLFLKYFFIIKCSILCKSYFQSEIFFDPPVSCLQPRVGKSKPHEPGGVQLFFSWIFRQVCPVFHHILNFECNFFLSSQKISSSQPVNDTYDVKTMFKQHDNNHE